MIQEIVGLNKGDHHSGATFIQIKDDEYQVECFLKERHSRQKNVGGWPFAELEIIKNKIHDFSQALVADNSFGWDTRQTESKLEENYPLFALLSKKGQEKFSANLNPHVQFVTHHFAHAMAAVAFSPFKKSIIIVQDGVGNDLEAFPLTHPERKLYQQNNSRFAERVAEACTVYLQDGPYLECVYKVWQNIFSTDKLWDDEHYDKEDFGEGLGLFYGTCAKYIFNSFHEAGKVMGLAPYGRPTSITNPLIFLENLDWGKSFKKNGKRDWENSLHFSHYANLAATAQTYFEENLFQLAKHIKHIYPDYDNLILTGGCALNCVANMKLFNSQLFKNIYVPPFPGDESISYGAAHYLLYHKLKWPWTPLPMDKQRPNLGALSSLPSEEQIRETFSDREIIFPKDLPSYVAHLLSQGKIIGWFQGRSESGPRALGWRSLLADPRRSGLQNHLNNIVKMRESFRPYGASCLFEKAHEYFEFPPGFDSPFMSFATPIRPPYRDLLKEVSHIDGTCRPQTVRSSQNPAFYRLIEEFGKLTGLFCLLNTSLNVMGEPIVETIQDAKRFLDLTAVDGLVVENFYIPKC